MEQQAVLDPQEEMLLLEILRNKRRIQALADTRARLVQIHDDALAAQMKQLTVAMSNEAAPPPRKNKRNFCDLPPEPPSFETEGVDMGFDEDSEVVYRSCSGGPDEDKQPALAQQVVVLSQIINCLENDQLWAPESAQETMRGLQQLSAELATLS